MDIATLIAAERLSDGDISAARDSLREAGVEVGEFVWIERQKACDLIISGSVQGARATLESALSQVDVVVQPAADRRRRLLAADMDSTMITVECIDELADFAGFKAEVAAVTEQAMQGEIAFEEALDRRVALLAGLEAATIDLCRIDRVRLTAGAKTLVQTMKASGAYCLLVSGGFTRFAEPVGEEIGFDAVFANILCIEEEKLTGKVERPIVGAESKKASLIEAAARRSIPLAACLAVGDGANDLPMLDAAGLGVAYHAKPLVAERADARIRYNDLTALLYAQGYRRAEWVIQD